MAMGGLGTQQVGQDLVDRALALEGSVQAGGEMTL
jgi:hypothetical protein